MEKPRPPTDAPPDNYPALLWEAVVEAREFARICPSKASKFYKAGLMVAAGMYGLTVTGGFDHADTTTSGVDYLAHRWYVHTNDVVGGWSILNVDAPPSRIDYRLGQVEVATFMSEKAARHIANLHNAMLADPDDAAP